MAEVGDYTRPDNMDHRDDEDSEIETRFNFNQLTEDGADKVLAIRENCREVAYVITAVCPESREKALALTNLEQAMFWANAAIARRS